jgi:hypothetical protein
VKTASKHFFSEEKKQKTFIFSTVPSPLWGGPGWGRSPHCAHQGNKSFLVLFFKKEHPSFPGFIAP